MDATPPAPNITELEKLPIWQHLPREIKVAMVKKLDYKSRCSLRRCSRQDRSVVDAVPVFLKRVQIMPDVPEEEEAEDDDDDVDEEDVEDEDEEDEDVGEEEEEDVYEVEVGNLEHMERRLIRNLELNQDHFETLQELLSELRHFENFELPDMLSLDDIFPGHERFARLHITETLFNDVGEPQDRVVVDKVLSEHDALHDVSLIFANRRSHIGELVCSANVETCAFRRFIRAFRDKLKTSGVTLRTKALAWKWENVGAEFLDILAKCHVGTLEKLRFDDFEFSDQNVTWQILRLPQWLAIKTLVIREQLPKSIPPFLFLHANHVHLRVHSLIESQMTLIVETFSSRPLHSWFVIETEEEIPPSDPIRTAHQAKVREHCLLVEQQESSFRGVVCRFLSADSDFQSVQNAVLEVFD